MGCTRSPFSGGLQCCVFCTGPVNPDVIPLEKRMPMFSKKFTLCSLMLAVGLCCMLLGYVSHRTKSQALAVRHVVANGGRALGNGGHQIGDTFLENLRSTATKIELVEITSPNELLGSLKQLPYLNSIKLNYLDKSTMQFMSKIRLSNPKIKPDKVTQRLLDIFKSTEGIKQISRQVAPEDIYLDIPLD